MTLKTQQWVARCMYCNYEAFPVLNTCVIMSVIKDDTLLLAQHQRHVHTDPPLYTVLAGFVEPGETLEQAVAREIYEEVGLNVNDICYFGSQYWPFPHNLMIGFTAQYESGEIRVDPHELVHAEFFKSQDLPRHPPVGNISHELILNFCRHHP